MGNAENLNLAPYWMKQEGNLDMACGIIAGLHAIFNNLDKVQVEPESVLDRFFKQVKNKTPA